jgi:hypothetical protein
MEWGDGSSLTSAILQCKVRTRDGVWVSQSQSRKSWMRYHGVASILCVRLKARNQSLGSEALVSDSLLKTTLNPSTEAGPLAASASAQNSGIA